MAGALDYLQKLSNNDWLITSQPHNFLSLAQNYYQELIPFITQNLTPRILIIDPDPIRFLAKFLATTAAELPVFLGDHQWGDQEWQQVDKLVQPNFVWQDELLSKTNPIPESNSSRIMIPTGGSSGVVKFTMHTWQTLSASVGGLQEYFQVSVINSFCVLPVYHVSGLMQFMRSLLTGGKLVITTSKYLETNLDFSINSQDFFISLVPTQLQKLLTNPLASTWLSQFQAVFVGGGAAWPELLNQARSLQIPLALTYGMTETASQIATLKPQDFLAGNNSCGQVLPHAQIHLVPSSESSPTPALTRRFARKKGGREDIKIQEDLGGLIAIQSSSLSLGYYPEPWPENYRFDNENKREFEREFQNKFETNDLGYFDPQGYLYITSRRSLRIITGGEKVFPSEVEAVILETKLVQDICVFGLPDSYWGEVVTAVYVPINSRIIQEINSEEIQAAIALHLTQHLAKYKHPKIWFPVEKLPRNTQGKINYQTLRKTLSASTQLSPNNP